MTISSLLKLSSYRLSKIYDYKDIVINGNLKSSNVKLLLKFIYWNKGVLKEKYNIKLNISFLGVYVLEYLYLEFKIYFGAVYVWKLLKSRGGWTSYSTTLNNKIA